MNSAVEQRFDSWLRRSAPMLSVLAVAFLGLVDLPFPGYTSVAPGFVLIAVYCWTVWRPELVPYWGVFLIGLLEDLLRGTPLGASALMLLLAQGFVRSQRQFLLGRTFDTFWAGFALVAVAVGLLEWILMSILYSTLAPVTAALFRYLLTIAVFPVLSVILLRIHRAVQRPE